MRFKTFVLLTLTTLFFLVAMTACGGTEEVQDETITIGIINPSPALDSVVQGFKDRLADEGYVEGENVIYLYDGPLGSNDIEVLAPAAKALVEQEPDLILAIATPPAVAVKAAVEGTDISVIFAPIADPLGAGLVTDLAQPGGNLTGVRVGGFSEKQLEWLLKIVPDIERIYLPYSPEDSASTSGYDAVVAAAVDAGVEIISPEVSSVEDIKAALANMPDDIDAIFINSDALILGELDSFISVASEVGIPVAGFSSAHVESGALLSYGLEFYPIGEQAARMALQLLGGADPATLPIESAEFSLSINLKTAAELGIEIDDSVLEQALNIVR